MFKPKNAATTHKPIWHAPWKLSRVIRGQEEWVSCIAVDSRNEWFATGSIDGTIKIWDLYSGELKLSLTAHHRLVRGLAVGIHQPYFFSCGEDQQIKCWDLECNKVIRHYVGNPSAVYGLDIHDTFDLLVSCGRDAAVRIWDVRSKVETHCLRGHCNTVSQVRCRASEPHIVSSSYDNTIRVWDIVAGKAREILNNHTKNIRALVLHPNLNEMATGSCGNLKQWSFPDGDFIRKISRQNATVTSLAINTDDVLVSGDHKGFLYFWDWSSAHNFQRLQSCSMISGAGIMALTFDRTDTRLISCEIDKTIKVYVEDQNATEESHPVKWKPNVDRWIN